MRSPPAKHGTGKRSTSYQPHLSTVKERKPRAKLLSSSSPRSFPLRTQAHSTVLPTYKDKVQQAFGALVAALPTSAQPINAWTANATKGLIPEIVDDATVADPLTRAVLVNAVYFKGSWCAVLRAPLGHFTPI